MSDLGSGCWLNFGWGAKKKDSSLLEDVSTSDFFSVEEDVIVENHGNHWEYQGNIVGPEGRSLYCLNLNCRAPPGRLLQPDLTGWWRDV